MRRSIIDLESRSDKILIGFAQELNCASASVCQTLIVWQKLVQLEEDREKARTEFKNSKLTQEQFDKLVADCQSTACELARCYNALRREFHFDITPGDLLKVLEARLSKDYESTLNLHGLS